MNLYILSEVLSDYTSGMAVIAAPSLDRCWELFEDYFEQNDRKWAKVTMIEGVNHDEGVVDYVYGGG
jgi:hypothetical protein